MDDTNQQNPMSDMSGMPPVVPVAPAADPMMSASSLSDLAGMTPPAPAPVPPSAPAPAMDTMGQAAPLSTAPAGMNEPSKDDYSYAEDILDEILDSLDRIEAKVEAIEKKLG